MSNMTSIVDLGNLGIIAPHKTRYYDRYNIDWLIETVNTNKQLKFITFWHEGDEYPNHYFSQWYQGKPFSVNGRSYITAEQYMMSEKALLFKDLYHYSLIMDEPSPKRCKELGRLVSGFDSTIWNSVLKEIVFHGNLGKYQSDIVLVDALLNTENAVLVEASPYDGIYGAGLTDGDLLNPNGTLKVMPEKWKNPKDGTQATNHLGFVLMGIRDLFRELMGHSWRPGEEYRSL
ncbi:MAG: NADAR family protein [Clostridia bacterium]|nr:NADAR family protein [Clostridia bacterium]